MSSELPPPANFDSENIYARQVVNRSSVASLCFLVWDILITTDDEVTYIWPKQLGFTKLIYLFVRYVPILIQISTLFIGTDLSVPFNFSIHDCEIFETYQGTATILVELAVDYLLILRLIALYHNSRRIRILVYAGLLLQLVGMAVGLGLTIPGARYDNTCLTTFLPWPVALYAGSSVVYQTMLFLLTAWKFFQSWKLDYGIVSLQRLMMRDGTWAYTLIFLVMVTQVCLFTLIPNATGNFLYSWLFTAFPFVGYRIVLNTHKWDDQSNSRGITNEVSELRFASGSESGPSGTGQNRTESDP